MSQIKVFHGALVVNAKIILSINNNILWVLVVLAQSLIEVFGNSHIFVVLSIIDKKTFGRI